MLRAGVKNQEPEQLLKKTPGRSCSQVDGLLGTLNCKTSIFCVLWISESFLFLTRVYGNTEICRYLMMITGFWCIES